MSPEANLLGRAPVKVPTGSETTIPPQPSTKDNSRVFLEFPFLHGILNYVVMQRELAPAFPFRILFRPVQTQNNPKSRP